MIVCFECGVYVKNTGQELGCEDKDHKYYTYSTRKFEYQDLEEELEYVGD